MRNGLDLTVQRYGRKRRLRRRLAAAGLALGCALAAGLAVLRFGPAAVAWLAALPPRAEAAVGDQLMPHYTEQLAELTAQNAALRAELAETAGLRAENTALRALLESPAAETARGSQPMPVAERTADGFALAGSAPAGAAVLDAEGRFAGRAAPDDARPGLLPVESPAGTPCLAEGDYGVLERQDGRWVLAGLPRHSGLQPGCLVVTADGWWVGTLAAAPAEDETGLCASAPLTDTADEDGSVYFVAQSG